MAINTHGSNIRTITNIANEWQNNDEYVGNRSHNEHNPTPSSNPWSTTYGGRAATYQPNREVIWQEEPAPPLVLDDELKAAIKRDLKIRNIQQPLTDSK